MFNALHTNLSLMVRMKSTSSCKHNLLPGDIEICHIVNKISRKFSIGNLANQLHNKKLHIYIYKT